MTETSERSLPQLLPWHEDAAAQLRKAWAANRLSHALLLQGAEGLGKQVFAAWLACAVLCDKSAGSELNCCGECAGCKLFAAGSHPDLLWVAPEEDKQQISIDQVRAATERLTKTSFRQGYKVAHRDPGASHDAERCEQRAQDARGAVAAKSARVDHVASLRCCCRQYAAAARR